MDFPIEMTRPGTKAVYYAPNNLAYVDAQAHGWVEKSKAAPAAAPKKTPVKSLKKSPDLEEILSTM